MIPKVHAYDSRRKLECSWTEFNPMRKVTNIYRLVFPNTFPFTHRAQNHTTKPTPRRIRWGTRVPLGRYAQAATD